MTLKCSKEIFKIEIVLDLVVDSAEFARKNKKKVIFT